MSATYGAARLATNYDESENGRKIILPVLQSATSKLDEIDFGINLCLKK